MKDVKIKPKTSPKFANVKNTPKSVIKGKEIVSDTVKDAKSAMKDSFIKQVVKKKLADNTKHEQLEQRPENYAVDNVENAAYTTADVVYQKSKAIAQSRSNRQNKVKTKEVSVSESVQHHISISKDNISSKVNDKQIKTTKNYNKMDSSDNKPATEKIKSDEHQILTVKTKEQYFNAQGDSGSKPIHSVKTKENYVQGQTSLNNDASKIKQQVIKNEGSVCNILGNKVKADISTQQVARQKYVSDKLKTKAKNEKYQSYELHNATIFVSERESENDNIFKDGYIASQQNMKDGKIIIHSKQETAPINDVPVENVTVKTEQKLPIKTKESYMKSLREVRNEPAKSSYRSTVQFKHNIYGSKQNTENANIIKTRKSTISKSKSVIKGGSVYTNPARQKVSKAKNAVIHTKNAIKNKSTKEAAKHAKQLAKKTYQATKIAVKVASVMAVKVAHAVIASTKAMVSAISALGGWAVLLVVLIVIIIVASIAASPFGIFISDEAADNDSIPISSIVAECNVKLSDELTEIEDSITHDRIVMEGEQADWDLVLSVFAVKVAGVDDASAQDVVVIDEDKKEKLKDVFWDINVITYRTEIVTNGEKTETVLYITITAKTKDNMIYEYAFTEKQQEALETLLENSEGYIGATQSLAISDATARDILDNLPDDLSEDRKNVIKAACSLVGKVNYFWGGKSTAIGWDSEWGKLKLVMAEGSRSSGSMRPFGLDCSGFVTWCFVNSGFSTSEIGHGTSGQLSKGTRVPWSDAEPGDLAFYDDVSHVGIIAGKDDNGNILVIHCSSSANNVVITTGGFGFAVRTRCY